MAMTKTEFHAACKRHGYTVAEFAEEFGVAPATAYEWGTRYGVPRWAVRVLGVMDQHSAAVFGRKPPRPGAPVRPVASSSAGPLRARPRAKSRRVA